MNNLTQISIIRSLLLGIWIFILVQSPLHNLSYLPIEASDPWGIGKLIFFFNDVKEFVFQRPVLLIIQGLTITLCIFSLFLTRQKWLLIITVFFIWVIDAIVKSHNGFINHAQIAPLYMLTLFALFQNIQSIPLNKLISLTSREKGKYQDFNSTEYSFFSIFPKTCYNNSILNFRIGKNFIWRVLPRYGIVYRKCFRNLYPKNKSWSFKLWVSIFY
jgi:hypothetical protein